jgi:hypothetical protein
MFPKKILGLTKKNIIKFLLTLSILIYPLKANATIYVAWVITGGNFTNSDYVTININWYLVNNENGNFSNGNLQTGQLASSTTAPFYNGNAYDVNLTNGNENLLTSWSVRGVSYTEPEASIWFYGSESTLYANTDFFIYNSLIDPTTISNAIAFSYSTTPEYAFVPGNTIFFKENAIGWIGPPTPPTPPTPPPLVPHVPLPSPLVLLGPGLLRLAHFRRKKSA